ncbi:RNA polymerase sigma-70 factor [Larkinella bovis]|uniref:RNA polymerase sigma-70 factor n=1 Tax=Larkinella bovis TaxID=683041 RepID=A0ABW0IH87_9BACT
MQMAFAPYVTVPGTRIMTPPEERNTPTPDTTTTLVDSELFIRKTFEVNAQKGCELLFRLYYPALCSHVARIVYSREIAEDLVADVFFTFWNTRAFQVITQSYRSYLFRSARNRAYNYLANELKKTDSLETALQSEAASSDSPELMMSYEQLYHKVNELVAALPPQCRKVFIMNRFEGRRPKDIAESLQLSVRTVEVHIGKALSTLRTGLKEQWLFLLLIGVLVGLS